MMEICSNCGEGESVLFMDEGPDSLPNGFYCENCYFLMARLVKN